jgi:type II secretory pathway component GspD/PulD (secretin)/beta-lactamase regulating signal transducer with metallopeptidase domain
VAALENILSPQIVQKLGWTLLHFVWQAGVVALLLAILLRALRKSTPNIRYIVACAAMALIILMPTITFSLLSAPEPASPVESIPISARVSAALQGPYDADMPLGRAAQYMQTPRYTSWQERADQVCAAVLPYLVAGWLVGVFGLSIWHLGGWAQLHRLKSRMVEDVNLFVHSTLQQLSGKLGVNKVVQVVKSALVEVPTVVGWIRPVVLLPASALTGLSSQQLEALLAHELAHIRRHDYLVNMLQTAVEILGFYHPAVWWISHTIRLERENCCDDMAISVCGDARQYVKALAEMERIRCGQAELAIAAGGGNLSRRISRLLGKEAGGKTHASWVPAVIAAILLIALAIPASLALSGADAEDTSAAAISNLAAGTTTNQMLPPAPSSAKITDKPQITVECTFFEVPADSEFVKGKNPGDVIIRLDGEFSTLLEALIRATQGAHFLTAPKAIMLDGEEAAMEIIGQDRPYIAGYEPGAGGDKKSKPIIENVFCGLELKIKANVVEGNAVHMDIYLTTRSKPTEQKDASGRTIHVTARNDFTTEITVNDGDTIVICGAKDVGKPNHNLVLQITQHIIRPDERTGIPAKADIKDWLAAAEPTKVAEYPVTMAIKAADYAKAANAKPGENPLGMTIRLVLDSIDQLTAAGTQIDDLREVRKILSAKGFTIDAANFSSEKCALIISKLIDDGIKGRLVCRLTKQNDRLLIDRIDFEPSARVEKPPAPVPPPARQAGKIVPTPPVPPAEIATIPVRAKSATPSAEDKTIIQIDCLVVEVFTDLKMDSETAATVKHLLGNKVTLRSPEMAIASELLRKVADATAASKEASAENQRVTEDQFKAIVEMLASKGYVKIMMNPTLQVVDGKTAKIRSMQDSLQDSLEITPHVLEDGCISLQVEAVLASKPTPDSKEQTPIVTKREISAIDVRVKPGQSLIIGGMKKTEKRSESHGDVRVVDERATEELFILTATIVAAGQQADKPRQTSQALLRALEHMHQEDSEPAKAQSHKVTTIFELKYADCDQAAATLQSLLTGTTDQIRIVSDARTNVLIIQAGEQDLELLRDLIREIDTPTDDARLKDAAGKGHQTAQAEQLRILEKERQTLAEKLQRHRDTIRQLAQEYGTADLTKHQDMKLQRVATLLDTSTKTEARRMQLETELKLLEQTGEQTATPQELLKMRQDHINNDPTIKALAEKLAQVEMELLLARQTSAESSPEITNKTRLLQGLKKRLDELKNEVGRSFDELMAEETAKGKQQKLARLQAELQQLGEYERRLSNLLNQEDSEIVKLGRKQLDIQDLQRQMDRDQQMYDTICRRIEELASVTKGTSERPKPEPAPSASPGLVLPAPRQREPAKTQPVPDTPPAPTSPAPKAQDN